MIQLINKQPIGMPFTETDEDLISAFSAQIGMCIEHCTNYQSLQALMDALEAQHQELQALLKRLPLLLEQRTLPALYRTAMSMAQGCTGATSGATSRPRGASGASARTPPSRF